MESNAEVILVNEVAILERGSIFETHDKASLHG